MDCFRFRSLIFGGHVVGQAGVPALAQAMLGKRYVDRVFRTTSAPNEPLATTSVWVGLYDGYF